MDHISRVSPASAIKPTARSLQRSLSTGDFTALLGILDRTVSRYPNQDLTDALPEYTADLEQLALKYSLQSVEDAICALRVKPDQRFFPTPDEVASEILRKKLKAVPSHIYARG